MVAVKDCLELIHIRQAIHFGGRRIGPRGRRALACKRLERKSRTTSLLAHPYTFEVKQHITNGRWARYERKRGSRIEHYQ